MPFVVRTCRDPTSNVLEGAVEIGANCLWRKLETAPPPVRQNPGYATVYVSRVRPMQNTCTVDHAQS